MAQAVERRIGNAEVTGPTPVASSVTPLDIISKGVLYFMKCITCKTSCCDL